MPVFIKMKDGKDDSILLNWTVGQERPQKQEEDEFFLNLITLNRDCQKSSLAVYFVNRAPISKWTLTGFITKLSANMYGRWGGSVDAKYAMSRLFERRVSFKNHLYCQCATVVRFQQTIGPSGKVDEVQVYWYSRHHLDGSELKVALFANGWDIYVFGYVSARLLDIDIFNSWSTVHHILLQKKYAVGSSLADGMRHGNDESLSAVLRWNGYQVFLELVCVLHPLVPSMWPIEGSGHWSQ